MSKKKIIVIGLVVLLILSLTANAVLGVMLAKDDEDDHRYLYDPQYAIGSDETVTDASEETTQPRNQIETPYITLSYSGELEDRITANTENQENGTDITFTCKAEEEELILFSVRFLKENPGDAHLGVLKDETNGDVYVVVNVNEQSPEDWSEETYKEICTLQEQVNDILIQIQEDPRFVANRPV